MISLSDLSLGPDPAVDQRQPIDDPLPDGAPVIDDPSREVPAVDPRRRDAPEPVREPQRDPKTEPTPH
jgi:hypothetical protein